MAGLINLIELSCKRISNQIWRSTNVWFLASGFYWVFKSVWSGNSSVGPWAYCHLLLQISVKLASQLWQWWKLFTEIVCTYLLTSEKRLCLSSIAPNIDRLARRSGGSGVAGVVTATPVWNVVWHRYGLAIPVFLVNLGLFTEMFRVWKRYVSATHKLSTLYAYC